MRFSNRAHIEEMVQAVKADHYGLSSIVHQIVQSDLFRNM